MYCIKYLKIEFHRHNNPTKVQNSGKIISFVKKKKYIPWIKNKYFGKYSIKPRGIINFSTDSEDHPCPFA